MLSVSDTRPPCRRSVLSRRVRLSSAPSVSAAGGSSLSHIVSAGRRARCSDSVMCEATKAVLSGSTESTLFIRLSMGHADISRPFIATSPCFVCLLRCSRLKDASGVALCFFIVNRPDKKLVSRAPKLLESLPLTISVRLDQNNQQSQSGLRGLHQEWARFVPALELKK